MKETVNNDTSSDWIEAEFFSLEQTCETYSVHELNVLPVIIVKYSNIQLYWTDKFMKFFFSKRISSWSWCRHLSICACLFYCFVASQYSFIWLPLSASGVELQAVIKGLHQDSTIRRSYKQRWSPKHSVIPKLVRCI